jgi:rRNA-processing protein FCF1
MGRSPEPRALLLDTNMITAPYQFGVDVASEAERLLGGCELVTLDRVVEELRGIGDKKAGKFGLAFIEKFKVRVEKAVTKNTDDALLMHAKKNNEVLCTNVALLKKRALALGVPVMFMRKMKTLDIAGGF